MKFKEYMIFNACAYEILHPVQLASPAIPGSFRSDPGPAVAHFSMIAHFNDPCSGLHPRFHSGRDFEFVFGGFFDPPLLEIAV
jgi:hypothetical protein